MPRGSPPLPAGSALTFAEVDPSLATLDQIAGVSWPNGLWAERGMVLHGRGF